MVPYGRNIEKMECANHVIQNYTKTLFRIQGVSTSIRSALTKPVIKRLRRGARSAIIYNAKHGQDSSRLRENLRNGPVHVFGMQKSCTSYFCKTKVNEGSLNGNRLQALFHLQGCLKPVLRKAHQLTSNKTSNLDENVMSLVAKPVGGAGLDFQLGPMCHYEAIKKAVGKSPPSAVKRFGQTTLKKCLFGTNELKNRKKIDVRGQEDYRQLCQKLDINSEE
ncbi:hypothetical protein ILUMI_03960 [Ignelater luminosus]|uniref:Mutator-like transposase domain-containing protein n=1 Tax=Ignelater luminosus TaxID=2038154 RepID=A0A8K0D9U4_IGNLU|nr:hypothetical protein ILUMI_03960 [Ignelater luminosus]